ncbi:hypothetical protein F5X97DRAFT_322009 [Nemania serpens]|nr:hypothetical protein F5X97DRAFT_322009 [Nemania serpens]
MNFSFEEEMRKVSRIIRGKGTNEDDEMSQPLLEQNSDSLQHGTVSAPQNGGMQPHADKEDADWEMAPEPENLAYDGPSLHNSSSKAAESSKAGLERFANLDRWCSRVSERRPSRQNPVSDLTDNSAERQEIIEQIKLVEAEISHHHALWDVDERLGKMALCWEAEEAGGPAHSPTKLDQRISLKRERDEIYRSLDGFVDIRLEEKWSSHTQERAELLGEKLLWLHECKEVLQDMASISRQKVNARMKPWYGRHPGSNKPSRAELHNHLNKRSSEAQDWHDVAEKELDNINHYLRRRLIVARSPSPSAVGETDFITLVKRFQEL